MPTVNLNKEVFEKLVGKQLPIEELKDRISMIGTDLESIKGNEIIVEVFPNRPDMLSEQGFARAFSSFVGVKTGLREYEIKDSHEKVIIDGSLNNIRPYTVCAIIKNLSLDDEKIREIMQIQEKLHVTHLRRRKKGAIGVYPMERISFPITFKAKKPKDISFAPLEFEQELTANKILSEHPAGKEYAHLLEGFSAYPIFEDANKDILSMPPIVNSHRTGKITESTKEVFIECSGFDMRVLEKCLNIIVTALADMGGEIYSLNLEYPGFNKKTPDLHPEKMDIDLDYVNLRLGLNLSLDDMKNYLLRMGYGFDGQALIPAYRADVMHMIDLVEDIAIAYGYENFVDELPKTATVGEENRFERFKGKVAQILIGLGFIETYTYNITNEEFQTKKMNFDIPLIKLRNALSNEYNTLRAWVVPSLMEVLTHNRHNEYPQNIFTIGDVFKKNDDEETGIKEDVRLGVVLCHELAGYTEIKQVLDNLLGHIGLEYSCKETDHESFISGRCARGYVGSKAVAYLGEIHPEVIEKWGLSFPVSALELNLTDIFSMLKEDI